MTQPEKSAQVDAADVFRRYVARSKQDAQQAAESKADLIFEIAHLEAYVAQLTARLAELESQAPQTPGNDPWGTPSEGDK